MIFAERSKSMLKYQKTKAKLFEYNIEREKYPRFGLDSNDLFFSTTFILSKYAESIILNDINIKNEYEKFLLETAQYYDAVVNSEDKYNYDIDFILSGATAYFFANNYGSSKVLLRKAYVKIDKTKRTPQVFLTKLLIYLFDKLPLEVMKEEDDYSKLNNKIKHYFEKGEESDEVKNLSLNYRKVIYEQGSIEEVFFVDLFISILFISIDKSAWNLLPIYTGVSKNSFNDYLCKKNGIKILWPAQQLIGETGILSGKSGIVQLPTGVGKTKSIELIIRSSFIRQSSSFVVIVAPLRALCNEITMDIMKAFRSEAYVNQLSDVLQDDANLFGDMNYKQIVICTPEKLSYIVHHQRSIIDIIDLFIFDEAHMFDDGKRGAIYELLMTHIRSNIDNKQLVLMSAVLPNAEEIKSWLFKKNGVVSFNPNILSTPKSVGFVSKDNNVYFISDNSKEIDYFIPKAIFPQKLMNKAGKWKGKEFPDNTPRDIAIYNALKLCNNGGCAIYIGRQNMMAKSLSRIIDLYKMGVDFTPFLKNADLNEINKLCDFFDEYYGKENQYSKCCKLGVVPHTSSVPNGIKLAVEHALNKEFIHIVICTSTLAQGVNIPIRYLFITNIRNREKFIRNRDFKNLIGRTARSGIFTEGSIIITDSNIYDKRKNKKGYFKWEKCMNMIDSKCSESCGSSILKLVQNIEVDYNFKISAEIFVNYYIEHIEKEDAIDGLEEKLCEEYMNMLPSNEKCNINNELNLRKEILESIENHLILLFENIEECDRYVVAKNLCKNTFAYSLANNEEKMMLESIFDAMVSKINNMVGENVHRYALSMSGIKLSKKIEEWLTNTDISVLLKSEKDCLKEILAFYGIIYKYNATKLYKNFDLLCELWIEGEMPKNMIEVTGLTFYKIDEICSKKISYELSFFIGNINDIVPENAKYLQLKNMLVYLQKRVKYGVKSQTAISICEKIFYDRVVATKLTDILGNDDIYPENILDEISSRKREVFESIKKFPTYFENRLNFLLT